VTPQEDRLKPDASTGARHDARRLSIEQLSTLLARAGATHATQEIISADVEAGAPSNSDGTVSIVQYAAWLAQEEARGGR
jgi:hypothetical protein